MLFRLFQCKISNSLFIKYILIILYKQKFSTPYFYTFINYIALIFYMLYNIIKFIFMEVLKWKESRNFHFYFLFFCL